MTYPKRAGYKKLGTSSEAAKAMNPVLNQLQSQVLQAIRSSENGLSSDGVVNATGIPDYTAKPRISELIAHGLVVNSGKREVNSKGKNITIWKVNNDTNS